ncbi:Uncharacterised protein at_DN0615 [Pycnogonum litorale]
MSEADIQKTAVITQFGLFEYVYMPFDLRNALATFQHFMDALYRDMDNVFVYVDDILITSESEAQPLFDLEKVFKILDRAGLKLSLNKCTFMVDGVKFSRHHLSSD